MKEDVDIASLGDLLDQLRSADATRRVFGSSVHGYRMGPVLSEADILSFESSNELRLPDDYRRFLAIVGNGGAGPFYGLEPLGTFGRDLSKPFTLVRSTEDDPDETAPDSELFGGVLDICHQGCGIFSYLVVNGPTFGTMWDGREDWWPTGLSFGAWYRSWAQRALTALSNEHLVSRLRVGMSRSDVLDTTGGDWVARPAFGRTISYFEASDIPAQLDLDEHGIVVKITPWASIGAFPR